MKRGIILFLLGMMLVVPLAMAQEQTYSNVDRFTDNVKLFFSSDDGKVRLALEAREKEVNSAIENTQNGNTEDATKNLNNAEDKLRVIQKKVSLETAEEVKTSVGEISEKITDVSEEFNQYKLEEEKTGFTAELTLKTYEYCKALAQEDYSLMLHEEICNPETAVEGLQKELEELKQIQKDSFIEYMLDIRSCIDDPGTCNCEDNTDITQKAKCEKMIALAIRCEYKDDQGACDELKAMEPVEGDNFAESFIPDFLMNLFREKQSMIDYDIEHSAGVPEECWDENDKPECEQYMYLKETSDKCWDEEGNFNYEECGGPKESVPTMQDSLPQCYDGDTFLVDKCGEITIVWNEEGLINYISSGLLDEIISNFENASEQDRIDIYETDVVNEMKEDINDLEQDIAERTFAEGTYDTGDATNDVSNVVVGEGNGDDGLMSEVVTSVDGGGSNDEFLPEPDLDTVNSDLYDSDATAPGDTIDDSYDDQITNEVAP